MLSALIPSRLSIGDDKSANAEREFKSVVLLKVILFVDWPANAFDDKKEQAPLVVGILGKDPIATAIEKAMNGERAHGRRLVVKRLRKVDDAKRCHLVFVCSSERKKFAAIAKTLEKRPILSVSDDPTFTRRGGVMALLVRKGKVFIQVNVDRARRQKIRISAKLLRLSEVVKDPDKEKASEKDRPAASSRTRDERPDTGRLAARQTLVRSHHRRTMVIEPHYAGIPADDVPSLPRQPVTVVLDNIRSAFNVGSIFRTADAAPAEHIHLCGMTAFPPNDRLARTALGATDYVPWSYHRKALDAVDSLVERAIPVIAVEVADDAVAHTRFRWPRPVAVVFGHEVHGIRPEVLERCDATVEIPMHGYKNSINVATAFGVVLYEILRQWEIV